MFLCVCVCVYPVAGEWHVIDFVLCMRVVCVSVCVHPVAGKWHVIDFVFWCVCCVFLCVCVCPSCGRRVACRRFCVVCVYVCCVFLCVCVCPSCGRRVACHRFCVVCVYVCGRPHATPLPGQIDQYP